MVTVMILISVSLTVIRCIMIIGIINKFPYFGGRSASLVGARVQGSFIEHLQLMRLRVRPRFYPSCTPEHQE